MFKRKLLSVLLAGILVLTVFTPVGAQRPGPDYSDPQVIQSLLNELQNAGSQAQEYFKKLPPEAQETLLTALTVAHVETQTTDNPAVAKILPNGSGCGTLTTSRTGYSAVGLKLWRYNQQVYRCWNGSKLTTAYRQNRWGEVYAPLWQFAGHTGGWTRGGTGQWSFIAWTQGDFRLCFGGWGIGCVQHSYPWIEQGVYGNGTYYGNSGG